MLDTKHPTLMFAAVHGLQQAEATEDKHREVSLENIRTPRKHPSGGPDLDDSLTKPGDAVTVTRRTTWNLRRFEPEFVKDVTVGTKGVIADWDNDEKRNVNLTITLTNAGQTQTITSRISTPPGI